MEEQQLFIMPDRFDIRMRLTSSGHWTLSIDRFVIGRVWKLDDRATYEGMSLAECADVLLSELFTVRT